MMPGTGAINVPVAQITNAASIVHKMKQLPPLLPSAIETGMAERNGKANQD